MRLTDAWGLHQALMAVVVALVAMLVVGLWSVMARLGRLIDRAAVFAAEFEALRANVQMVSRAVEVVGHRLEAIEGAVAETLTQDGQRLNRVTERMDAMSRQLAGETDRILEELGALSERLADPARRPRDGP